MKYYVYSSLVMAISVTTEALLLTTPVIAQQIPSSVINGVLRPKESFFFRDSREKFEREIQLLLESRRSAPETLLKIDPKLPQNIQQRSPDATIKSDLDMKTD